MPGRKTRVVIIFSLALLILETKEPFAAAENSQKASSPGLSDRQLCEILVAIAKVDPKLKVIWTPDFSIESGDLKINVKADKSVVFDGKPYQNSSPQTGLYGQVNVSDKFYGVELVLHYLLLRGNAPFSLADMGSRIGKSPGSRKRRSQCDKHIKHRSQYRVASWMGALPKGAFPRNSK